MDINTFVKKFELLLEEVTPGEIQPSTEFRNLGEWSSLIALTVIVMVDEECGYKLTNDDFKDSKTLEDLFLKIKHA